MAKSNDTKDSIEIMRQKSKQEPFYVLQNGKLVKESKTK
jgi:hypothetical protein